MFVPLLSFLLLGGHGGRYGDGIGGLASLYILVVGLAVGFACRASGHVSYGVFLELPSCYQEVNLCFSGELLRWGTAEVAEKKRSRLNKLVLPPVLADLDGVGGGSATSDSFAPSGHGGHDASGSGGGGCSGLTPCQGKSVLPVLLLDGAGILGGWPRPEGLFLLHRLRLGSFPASSSPCSGEGFAGGARDVFPADVLEPEFSSRPCRRAYMRYSKPTMATAFAGGSPSGAASETRWWCSTEAQLALKTTTSADKDLGGLRCNFLFPRVLSAFVRGQLGWLLLGVSCVFRSCIVTVLI